MIEAYEIGASMALDAGGVQGGLSAIGRDAERLGHVVGRAQDGLLAMRSTLLAIGGAEHAAGLQSLVRVGADAVQQHGRLQAALRTTMEAQATLLQAGGANKPGQLAWDTGASPPLPSGAQGGWHLAALGGRILPDGATDMGASVPGGRADGSSWVAHHRDNNQLTNADSAMLAPAAKGRRGEAMSLGNPLREQPESSLLGAPRREPRHEAVGSSAQEAAPQWYDSGKNGFEQRAASRSAWEATETFLSGAPVARSTTGHEVERAEHSAPHGVRREIQGELLGQTVRRVVIPPAALPVALEKPPAEVLKPVASADVTTGSWFGKSLTVAPSGTGPAGWNALAATYKHSLFQGNDLASASPGHQDLLTGAASALHRSPEPASHWVRDAAQARDRWLGAPNASGGVQGAPIPVTLAPPAVAAQSVSRGASADEGPTPPGSGAEPQDGASNSRETPLVIHTNLHLDGHVVAQVVTKRIVNMMNGPLAGPGGFDPRRSFTPVDV